MKLWWMALVLTGCLMTPVMHFGSGKSAKEAQHDTLNSHLLPPELEVEGRWKGPVKDAKIRVYADDQFRAQNVHWQQAFGERLEYANAVLGSNFGVRLVPDYREWKRHSPGSTLEEDLDQLRALDAGDDVQFVIGLTSSLSLVSATFEELGVASVPGRHMMLRGYADVEERKAFARAFPDLSQDERDNALEARRLHKTTTILLHELAHNLGVEHETAEDTIMNAIYSVHAAAYSSDVHATVQRSFDQRLGRAPAGEAVVPIAASAPVVKKQHERIDILLLASGVMVEGKMVDEGSLNIAFSAQAAADAETEIVISKEKSVPTSRVIELIDRAKAQGLKNVSFK